MVKKTRYQDLDRLRSEIRNITLDILARVHRRMELAEQIGSIKDNLNIEIEDEEVEQDVRRSVSELSQTLG
ncbi:MAG: chorismate mutase, partial [Nitrososphaeraceae archaeon]|nr:chorismate mutase [Nitrososphaeraceae archaeon]